MDSEGVRVLLIEDNPRHAQLLREAMGEAGAAFAGAPPYELLHVDRLAAGLERLAAGGVDVVLLDLSLPDGTGVDGLVRLRQLSPNVPVVALVGMNEDVLAAEALQAGAQDYLSKGRLGGALVARSIRYAVQLNKLQSALRSLALIDGLTGLYNRRGFISLAEPHMKLAQRAKGKFLVVSADIAGLKEINTVAGYDEGDRVLRDAADILRQTFRDCDLIARLEGGTFAVLAVDAALEQSPIITARLQQHVAAYNGMTIRRYTLSINGGFAPFVAGTATSIEDLMAQATKARRGPRRSRRTSQHTRARD